MKENETYVNSLQGHLSQLNSAWQELAKNTIDSDFIKGILATTTSLIKFTDEIGGLPVVLAAATSALMLFKGGLILDKVFGTFSSGLSLIKNGLTTLIYALPNAVAAFKSFSAGVITAGTAMQAATPLLSVIALAITGVVAGIKAFTKAQEEAQEAALKANEEAKKNIQSKEEEKKKIQEEIDKLHKEIDAYKENGAAKNSAADNAKFLKEKNDEIAKRQDNIDAIQKEIDKNLELREANARTLTTQKADSTGLGWNRTYGASNMEEANRLREGIKEINKELKNAEGNTGAYNRILEEQMQKYNSLAKTREENNQSAEAENEILKALSKEISANSEKYEKDKKVSDEFYDILQSGGEIQDSQLEWFKRFNGYTDEQIEKLRDGIDIKSEDTQKTEDQTQAVSEQTEKQKELANATEETNSKFKDTNTSIDELQKSYSSLKSAVDEYNNNGYLTVDTLQSLLSLGDEYLSMLSFENGQLVLNTTELDNYTNALVAQRIETAQNAAVQDIWNLAAGNTASMSDTAKAAIAELEGKVSTTGGTFSNQVKGINEYTQALLEAKAAAGADTDTANFEEKANAIISSYQKVFSNISKISSGTYGGGGYSRTGSHRYSGTSKSSKSGGTSKSTQSEYKATIDTLYKYNNALDIAKDKVDQLSDALKNTDNLKEQEKITKQLIEALNNQIQKTNELKAAQTSQINDYINQLKRQGFAIDYNNQTNELYINNMEHLADFSGDTAKNLEKLIKKIQSLNSDNVSLDSSVRDLTTNTKKYYDQLAKYPEKKLKQFKELMDDFQQSQLDQVQNQIDDIQHAMEQDPQLKALKEQLEAMKEQTNEKDKQAELEEKMLAVEKAREALENARNQKTLQVYKQGLGWIWETDPDTIASAEKDLADAEKDFADTRSDQNQEALEKQIEDLENSYQDQIDKLQNFLDEQNYQIDKANRSAVQSFEELAAAMKKYGIDSAENLSKAKEWLDNYNKSLAEAKKNVTTLASSGSGVLYSSDIQGFSTSGMGANISGMSLSGVKFAPTGDTNNSSIYIDRIELPNVSNANEFVEALKTLPTLATAQATSRKK